MSKKIISLYFGLFISLLSFSLSTKAQVDPSIEWKTLHLPHFELVYDARHQELANIYAARLEAAYANVAPLFPAGPIKTTVVLDDHTDLTNGAATVFPYPLIMVYPVLPAPQESIGEYNDWASELVTHEFTHILAMSPQRDTVLGLSYFFGSLMSPNILLPRWWHEGLAVEMETRFSTAGRLRSPQQDAWLRSYVLDNHWNEMKISEANEVNIPTWPYGARPYLIGAAMWSELIEMKTPKIAHDLSWAHGGRLPYLINQPAENLIGMTYYDLFDLMHTKLEVRLKNQISQIKTVPPTNSESLNFKEVESFTPSLSPDGLKMAFIGKDETTKRSLRVLIRPALDIAFNPSQMKDELETRTGETSSELHSPLPRVHLHGIEESSDEDGPPGGSISRLSWFADSQRIVFDKVDDLNWYQNLSDLYIYNIKTDKVERLSSGLRAREPVVSPDGKFITFVKVLPGKTEIANFDLEKKIEVGTLISAPLQARCSHPTYLDAQHLIFSYREHGQEFLQILDLQTHQVKVILPKFTNSNFPSIVNGKLFFTSSVNGIHNLYVANDTLTSAKPVTHSLSAIFESTWDWSRDEYYLSEQTSQGLKMNRLNARASAELPIELPMVGPLFVDRYPANRTDLKTVDESEVVHKAESKAEIEDYSSAQYLLPKYWLPWFSWDSFSSYLSASTSSQDPLNKHAWSANGLYDIGFNHLSYSLSYLNMQTSAKVLTTLSDLTVTLPGNVPERNVFDNIQINWEFTTMSPYLQGGIGWTKMNRIISPLTTNQTGPSLQMAYSNFAMSGAQISPESGFGGGLMLTSFLPGGGQLDYNQAELSLVKYWSSFLPKRHALMAKFQSFMMDKSISANYAYTFSQQTFVNTAMPQYLMRAYPSATFQGRVLNNLTLEYRFPIKRLYHGWKTTPIFFKQVHAAVIADGVNLDGFAYNSNSQNYQRVRLSESFWSVGGEGRVDTTLGYQFPLTFYAGVYIPSDFSLTSGPNLGLGIYF